MKELSLPEWVFLDGTSHEGNKLEQRTVILHVRSMTVIEILNVDESLLNEDVLKVSFKNSVTGEKLIAALHFSTTIEGRDLLIDILKKCAVWYCDYCDWEDEQFF